FKAAEAEGAIDVDCGTDARWLDEVGAPGGSAVHHRRTFLQFHKTDGGRARDPGLEGVSLGFVKVGDQVSVSARAPRQILKKHLQQQTVLAPAIGLWVEMPERV